MLLLIQANKHLIVWVQSQARYFCQIQILYVHFYKRKDILELNTTEGNGPATHLSVHESLVVGM